MQATKKHTVFVTGATGYLGSRLVDRLVARGHIVRSLVRKSSKRKVPDGVLVIEGNALDASTFTDKIAPADTVVHLIGVAHPSPSKAAEFLAVDLKSVQEIVPAAVRAGVKHIVYVSVAQGSPVMRAYQDVRRKCEEIIVASGLNATILRPFYVVGPGHYWILLVKPITWLMALLPPTRDLASKVATVPISQMLRALEFAVENPATGIHIMDIAEIKAMSRQPTR